MIRLSMKAFSVRARRAAIAAGVLALAATAEAQVSYSVVHNFTGYPSDGAAPYASLIQGGDGMLYGTTYGGGSSGVGTVFQMATDGSSVTVLHSFTISTSDGSFPQAGLIQSGDGTLYGTTYTGGADDSGTVFKIATDGSGFGILHSFTIATAAYPTTGLIQGSDGTLYGTTSIGGSAGDGTVFSMAADGSAFTVIHSFSGTSSDGAIPSAALIQGPDGTLYGTTGQGGSMNSGTVFEMATDGSGFALLHSFSGSDGTYPDGLIQGSDGTLYGTTYGGSQGYGSIFKMASDGSAFASLYGFSDGSDGALPYGGVIQGTDGTLYGMASLAGSGSDGTIFQAAPDGSSFTVLYSFSGSDGSTPKAGLILGADGAVYGTTNGGGTAGSGVVFQLSFGS